MHVSMCFRRHHRPSAIVMRIVEDRAAAAAAWTIEKKESTQDTICTSPCQALTSFTNLLINNNSSQIMISNHATKGKRYHHGSSEGKALVPSTRRQLR
mmetsp:Transcript_6573/g.12825  ORF Transcript_6573/g.12825 Transcript_6573/m.12825 type:complete len:98 (+) Transcript_6573:5316-5609(+)